MASGDFGEITLGTGLTGTDVGGGVIEIAATGGGGASPTDTAGWMPLTTVGGGVPDLVWDASDSLIPTYTPF